MSLPAKLRRLNRRRFKKQVPQWISKKFEVELRQFAGMRADEGLEIMHRAVRSMLCGAYGMEVGLVECTADPDDASKLLVTWQPPAPVEHIDLTFKLAEQGIQIKP